MGESARRRTRTAAVSFLLTLLITAGQAEHPDQETDNGGSNGVVTTLTTVPRILADLAHLLGDLTRS